MKINLTLKKAIVEFLGVLIFVTAVAGALISGSPFGPAAAAITLGLAMLITGAISGSHLNPAVSLVFYARGQLSLVDLGAYLAAQIAGAFGGVVIGTAIWGGAIRGMGMDAMPAWSSILGELFATGGLVFLFLFLSSEKKAQLLPVAVGLWVFATATFTQTGAQSNPAVSLALTIADPGQGLGAASWYILAQLAGALIAVLFTFVFAAKTTKRAATKKKAVAKKK